MDRSRMMVLGPWLMLTPVMALAFCSERGSSPPGKPVRDVPYYLAHAEERAAVMAACRQNPGGLWGDANCINAETAANKRAFDPSNKGMPEIKLDAPGKK